MIMSCQRFVVINKISGTERNKVSVLKLIFTSISILIVLLLPLCRWQVRAKDLVNARTGDASIGRAVHGINCNSLCGLFTIAR